MGNKDIQGVRDQLHQDMILHCPKCSEKYNLTNKLPIMVCQNQHNYCLSCFEMLGKKNICPDCKDGLFQKMNKNNLICYILEKMHPQLLQLQNQIKIQNINEGFQNRRYDSLVHLSTPFNTFDSKERRPMKLKSNKRQQSIPNLNLQQYNQQRQFRKKYSVASVFSTKTIGQQMSRVKPKQQTFADNLNKYIQQYQIIPFKNILIENRDPTQIINLDLHLYKIPKIFDIFCKFTSLIRLNLNKNRISKMQNLQYLKSLNYLSLSDNLIDKIDDLLELSELKNLYLNKNKVSKIQGLSNLAKLQFLGLGNNLIEKIQNIDHLLELKWLNLEGNYISKVQGFAHLLKLQIIMLSSNQIDAFQGFQNLPALQQIQIDNNKINNIQKALNMKHLRKIKLQDNPGLHEQNSKDYLKLLQIIEAKSKGIQKSSQGCIIY